jgi:exosome complex exonuclease DIS3/RRP44
MIPKLLSTNLCSLHEKVDRLVFSVIWEITPEAEIVSSRYHKSVINSVGAFTYGQAQERYSNYRNLTCLVNPTLRHRASCATSD